ncbi:hypothetical protein MNR01_02480 [Lysobacter sp. S4-A87]|uniref:hypothetical protein n=1 Tax=Lysobacter sp. S4-A87 TaxID=2925843 RepID=UPI001F53A61E|nr:hypothetical protein [Lysobacter sp. S4-A87]UNK49925.1 hypothetical protein MNR01_02480 [Lysobacter sp. S4-A87]
MNAVRLLTALFVGALVIPAAHAQQSAGRNAGVVTEATVAAGDNFLAARTQGVPQQLPWTTRDAAADPAFGSSAARVDLKFADQTPLKPGMFDSATAWEDEP